MKNQTKLEASLRSCQWLKETNTRHVKKMWQTDQSPSESKFYNSLTMEITDVQRGLMGCGHYAGVLENTGGRLGNGAYQKGET